ncbi:MAG: DUF3426 domain-containing protein [Thermodesulfobacteriota bacterium]
MIITCPECKTKYRLSEEKVKSEGTRVRCSRCGHVFTATPQDDISAQGSLGQDSSPTQQPDPDQDLFSTVPGREDDQARVRPRKRKWGTLVFILFIALLLGAGGYLFWPQIETWIPFVSTQPKSSIELSQKTEAPVDTKDIALKDVRQYMVDNQNLGRILVIEGQAVNTSESAKQMIKILATLFDEQGNRVAEKEFWCGNTASVYELQELSQEELQKVLSAQAGILTTNSHVPPEQKVAFMTVFFEFPDQVAEFSLKVVQAREAGEAQMR